MASTDNVLRLGTRGSLLARMQSQIVADELEKRHPGLAIELVICKTTGDKVQDRPLHEVGGKGVFTKKLEESLLAGTIDFAVHSFKDVPVTMPLVDQSELIIAAVPIRQDVRDVLVSGKAKSLSGLPSGAKVGTSSLRRKCQLLDLRSDLQIEFIRGNIDTRIRKLRDGIYDAVILAMAGLKRSATYDETDMTPIPTEQMLPAAGQGALAIQCRKSDSRTAALLAVLDDPITHQCVDLEREVVRGLNGDCHSPIAAWTQMQGNSIHLQAALGSRDGGLPVKRASADGDLSQAANVLKKVLDHLR